MVSKISKIASLVLCVSASSASADSFGAFAYGEQTRYYGYSTGYSSQGEAERVALEFCFQNGVRDCKVVLWYKNACASLSLSENGAYGVAWNTNQLNAENAALDYCIGYGGVGCYIEVTDCSY